MLCKSGRLAPGGKDKTRGEYRMRMLKRQLWPSPAGGEVAGGEP
jgi:hypothetical protein